MVHKANQTDLITKVKNVKSFTYFIYKYFYQESHKHLKHANALLQKQQVNRKKKVSTDICHNISEISTWKKNRKEMQKSVYSTNLCSTAA